GMIHLQLGELEDATRLLSDAMSIFQSFGEGSLPWYAGVLAYTHFVSGDLSRCQEAMKLTKRVVDSLPAGALPRAASMGQLALIAVRAHDLAECERLYGELLAYAGQHHWILMDRALGSLALELGRQVDAIHHFEQALSAAERGAIDPEAVITGAELAR